MRAVAVVLEVEEGCNAIVQSKNIALRKIRGRVGRSRSVRLIVGQLSHGDVFISVIVVGIGKLTESRRAAIADRGSASTRRRTRG